MPKSKRSKIVSLTQTKPKQKELKDKTMQKLEANFKKFNNIHLFELHNLTSENQKSLTNELPGVVIFGKKTLMRVFFSDKLKTHPQLEEMIEILTNPSLIEICLFMTNSPSPTIIESLKSLTGPEFTKPGSQSSSKF